MKKSDLYTSILKKLSLQKEQSIISLSFINEIMYHITYANDISGFVRNIVNAISKHIGNSAIYLMEEKEKRLRLKSSKIKNVPVDIELKDYKNFIDILRKKSTPDLTIKQMELSEDIKEYVSFVKRFSIIPLAAKNAALPIGIILIDVDLENVELVKLQALNTATVLISNSISYSALLQSTKTTQRKIIKLILKIMFFADLSTYRHSIRVKKYSLEIAKALSFSKKDMRRLHLSSLLHDVGKIAMPYDTLHKEDNLSKEEFEIIKQHVVIGYELLKEFPFFKSSLPDILNHHEKLDGSGYPNGIKNIDMVTQVLAATDIIDAISSTRSYKSDKGFSYITDEIEKLRGQFNKSVINAAVNFINSNRFLILKKSFKANELLKPSEEFSSLGNMTEKIYQLRNENNNLKKQTELYKRLLYEAQETIENITKTAQRESESKYKSIIKIITDYIKPVSTVFTDIEENTLTISKIEGSPLNLENSINLLSNKKLIKNISSKTIYISHRIIAFPLSNQKAACAILSKDVKIDEESIEKAQKSLENIIKTGYN